MDDCDDWPLEGDYIKSNEVVVYVGRKYFVTQDLSMDEYYIYNKDTVHKLDCWFETLEDAKKAIKRGSTQGEKLSQLESTSSRKSSKRCMRESRSISAEDIIDKYSENSFGPGGEGGLSYSIDDAIQEFSIAMDEEGILPWNDDEERFECSDDEIRSAWREYNSRWNSSWLEDDFGLSDLEAEIVYDYMEDQVIEYYGSGSINESKSHSCKSSKKLSESRTETYLEGPEEVIDHLKGLGSNEYEVIVSSYYDGGSVDRDGKRSYEPLSLDDVSYLITKNRNFRITRATRVLATSEGAKYSKRIKVDDSKKYDAYDPSTETLHIMIRTYRRPSWSALSKG